MDSYRLKKAEKTQSGIIKHTVLRGVEEIEYKYSSVRVGMVWPSIESPGFYIVAGEEVWDAAIFPADRGVVRVLDEVEIKELSLNSLFDSVTDAYTSHKADTLYCDFKQEDYKASLWEYLDSRNLRNITAYDIPYKDFVMRLSLIADYNSSGDLVIDKGSPLYEDLKGISRSNLGDNPETKFYRLNCLSYVISGFSKYRPIPPLKSNLHSSMRGWQL